MRTSILAALLALLAPLLASGGESSAERAADRKAVNIDFHVEDADGACGMAFRAGEPLTFVFEIRNDSSTATAFYYTFPPHRVTVTPATGGAPAWRAFADRMFAQVMRRESLAPGETRRFTVGWKADAPAGEYRVRPEFIAFDEHGRIAPGLEALSIVLRNRQTGRLQ